MDEGSGADDSVARVIVHQALMPLVGATIGVAVGTGRWDLSAVGTGLAVTGALALFAAVDRAFLEPRVQRIGLDWLRLETEMVVSVVGHVAGALLALLVCGRLFGFRVELKTSWLLLAGIVLAFPIFHGAEMGLRYYRQLRERERKEQELQSLATEAELRALKAQMSPHFLFNALNTIAALIDTQPGLAEASVERLAALLRYVLASGERGLVSLGEELGFVEHYLEIERARFGDRLRVFREIDDRALAVRVPSLIMQPLVENAVRHGHADDGTIRVELGADWSADKVRVWVADQGPGMPAGYRIGDGSGHGLRIADERLRKTYGHGLVLEQNSPTGTRVVVAIPA
jgi:signal transduction histidine kinase